MNTKRAQYAIGAGLLLVCLFAMFYSSRWDKKVVGTWGTVPLGNDSYGVRLRFNENGTMQFRTGIEDFDGHWKVTNRLKGHLRFGPHTNDFESDSFAVTFKGGKMILSHLRFKSEVWECVRIPDHKL